MRLVATRKSHQNSAVLDPWTGVHAGIGLAFGLTEVPFWTAAAVAIGYELVEQQAERSRVGQELFQTSGPETPLNAVADVMVFLGAWWLGRRWNAS